MSNSLTSQITSSSDLPRESVQSIESTLNALLPNSTFTSNSNFDASNLSLTHKGSSVPPAAVKSLVLTAQQMVNSLRDRSSILGGLRSESDEYGDVGVWLGEGDYGKGRETDVLRALGMEGWLEGNISPDSVQDPKVDALDLSAFEDIRRFRVEGKGDAVALFLLGRTAGGWGGLISVATWT